MKNVLVDLDGVMVDMCGAVKEFLNRRGKDLIIENITKYNFSGDIGCDRSDVFEALNRVETFQLAKYYEGAVDALKRLQTVANTTAYTGVPASLFIIAHRNQQIRELHLNGEALFGKKGFTTGSKGVVEGSWDAVFEDSLDTLKAWENEHDVKLFLINHSYNSELNNPEYSSLWERVIRCENFADAVDKYIEMCL